MSSYAIEAKDVSKSYGKDFTLSNINLSIKKGEVFALVGQNGAGKTTLVKLILNLLRANQGEINLFGQSSTNASSRKLVGFIPEKFSFFPYYTVEGVLNFFADSRGLNATDKKLAVQNAMEKLSLTEIKDRKISTFSKGQFQRVGLASLLIGNLELLILDEPFSGLDPLGIIDLKNLIREFKEAGKTVFINSHILLEMEMICDSFAMLKNGKLVHHGPVAELKSEGLSLEELFTKKVLEK